MARCDLPRPTSLNVGGAWVPRRRDCGAKVNPDDRRGHRGRRKGVSPSDPGRFVMKQNVRRFLFLFVLLLLAALGFP